LEDEDEDRDAGHFLPRTLFVEMEKDKIGTRPVPTRHSTFQFHLEYQINHKINIEERSALKSFILQDETGGSTTKALPCSRED
jgi:hypothetical protein